MYKVILLFISFLFCGTMQAYQEPTVQVHGTGGVNLCTAKRAGGFLSGSEYIIGRTLAFAASGVLKGLSFTRKYPRISCTVILLAPWMFSRTRQCIIRQCYGLMCCAARSIATYVHNRMSLWLVGSLPNRVGDTERALGNVSQQLEELRGLYDQHGQDLREVRFVQGSHSSQLCDIIQQLKSIKSDVERGNRDIVLRIAELEKLFQGLSGEQKQFLQEYGNQFGLRLDQLSKDIGVLLRYISMPRVASCSSQVGMSMV
jgi:hypothetical protein